MSTSLADIITAVKDGERPEYEELLFTVIALEALRHFDFSALLRLGTDDSSAINNARFQAEESFQRTKRAMNTPPREYVGWTNDPQNPDYQKTRQVSKKILNKIANAKNREANP